MADVFLFCYTHFLSTFVPYPSSLAASQKLNCEKALFHRTSIYKEEDMVMNYS